MVARAKAGFEAVEFLFPYEWPATDVAKWREAAGVEQILINMPPGDWEAGELGVAALPGRKDEFKGYVAQALECRRWRRQGPVASRRHGTRLRPEDAEAFKLLDWR